MDSMEDRIAQKGKHDEFSAAYEAFNNSNMNKEKQSVFYDELISFGASAEEADEFINMVMEN